MPEMPPMEPPVNEEPPMDMGNEDTPMDDPMGGDVQQDENGGQDESQLQKMSGELSQELRDYNQAHPDDEQGMNKYVLGMVSSAAAGTLKTSDIKKIKANLEGDGNDDTEDDLDNQDAQPDDMGMQEGKHNLRRIIDEIVNGVMDNERKQTSKREGKKLNKKYQNDSDNPFVSQW